MWCGQPALGTREIGSYHEDYATIFCDVTSCKLQSCFGSSYCIHLQGTTLSYLFLFYPEDGHSTFLRNVATDLPDYMACLEDLTHLVNTIRTKSAFHAPCGYHSGDMSSACFLMVCLTYTSTREGASSEPLVAFHRTAWNCGISERHDGATKGTTVFWDMKPSKKVKLSCA
jgi:hypothetical protein